MIDGVDGLDGQHYTSDRQLQLGVWVMMMSRVSCHGAGKRAPCAGRPVTVYCTHIQQIHTQMGILSGTMAFQGEHWHTGTDTLTQGVGLDCLVY